MPDGELPPLPANIVHVMRRIRACESDAPAQIVLEYALHEYARAAIAQAVPQAVPEGMVLVTDELRSKSEAAMLSLRSAKRRLAGESSHAPDGPIETAALRNNVWKPA